jgi:hypothetical protein
VFKVVELSISKLLCFLFEVWTSVFVLSSFFSVENVLKLAESPCRDTYLSAKRDFPLAPIIFWRIRRTEIGRGSDGGGDDDDDDI